MKVIWQSATLGRWGLWILLWMVATPAGWAQDVEALRQQLEAEAAFQHPDLLRRFYQEREYKSAWVAAGQLTSSAQVLVRTLRVAEQEGFDLYAVYDPGMESLLKDVGLAGRLAPSAQIALDLRLTDAFFHYSTFLLQGRVDPRTQHTGWNLARRRADLVALLEGALQTHAMSPTLARLKPPYPQYERLEQALERYQHLAEEGGWQPLATGATLRLGDMGGEVQALRERLRITGDIENENSDSLDYFDAVLDWAVRAFQRRHGLEEDGIVGNHTRTALNFPVEVRIRQIMLNLERLRWLPEDLGSRYLLINIAGYSLQVVERDATVLAMRVIVGTPRTPTPVFSTRLTEVVLAPYWNVPTSIARNEILPRVRRDPGYLSRNHMKTLSGGRIRQDPGPTNPLGRVKFTIPNRYGVGLHDTPARYLFAESICAFSHGCMRLERPLDLAAYVLRADTIWTRERMAATIERWQETRIPAPEPLPVYVLYWTAWVDDQGILQFRPDIYGHDDRLDRVLQRTGGS